MMILKNRARKPIANGRIESVGHGPQGVGGMPDGPVHSVSVGDYKVFFYAKEWNALVEQIKRLEDLAA